MNDMELYVDSFKTKYEAFLAGCDSLEEVGRWNKDAYGEMDAFYSNDLASVIIRLIVADGKITSKEVEYVNQTFGFDYTLDEMKNVYRSSKESLEEYFDEAFENGITYMRRVNRKLADSYKELLSLICRIVIHSDGVVTESELSEVRRLLEMCD